MSSILVAVKLHSKESQGILQYVLTHLADTRQDTIHVLCVVLQKESREQQRKQAQDLVRQQYGTILRGRTHRLHIVRVLHSGSDGDKTSAAAYIARAICAKASLLQSNVIVVGGKMRPSALGTQRGSAVADAVRKHSRQPVLLITDEHPLLEQALPSIAEVAEEPHGASEVLPAHLASALQPSSPAATTQRAHDLIAAAVPGVQAHVRAGPAPALKGSRPRSGQADGQQALTAC